MFSLKAATFSYRGSSDAAPQSDEAGLFVIDDLEIARTGMTAIIGPSGSGKTTLLSILAGFLTPTLAPGGAFTFDGTPVAPGGHPPQRVAFVFQSPMLLGAASGLANAMQGAVAAPGIKHMPLTEAQELGRCLRLIVPGRDSLLAKRARLLSGGEAQRMSILRALLADPQIILGDEPTSSLDEANATLALDALQQWSTEKQRPVAWVTHNLGQAARYAQHHVFMSGGQLRQPPPDVADDLASDDYETRLAALRRFSAELSGEVPDTPQAPSPAADTPTGPDVAALPASEAVFSRWVANALSTDGLGTDKAEAQNRTLMVPGSLATALTQVEPGLADTPPGALRRTWMRVKHYSRYSLSIILGLMLLQIVMAWTIGMAAQNYARERLNDPSVARLVFELFIDGQSEDEIRELELFGARVQGLEQAIAQSLVPGASAQDLGVAIFPRRTLPQSRLQFQTPEPRCNGWQTFETAVLDRRDPLVGQAVLAADFNQFEQSIPPVLDRAALRATALAQGTDSPGSSAAIALIDRRIADVLVQRCGVDPTSGLFEATWDSGLNYQTDIALVAVLDEQLPLYPGLPQLIVFEDEYQAAFQAADEGQPDAARIATAYFPIQGFDRAERVLVDAGYRIRDDSAAAVQSLQQIDSVATNAPFFVTLFALVISAAVIGISMSALFEINKRVLALYIAHGMRRSAISLAFLRHFAPAFWVAAGLALIVALAFGALIWAQYGVAPTDMLSVWDMVQSYLVSLGMMLTVSVLGALSVIALWWRHTRQRLKTYLQE